jgi:hypothetical protein
VFQSVRKCAEEAKRIEDAYLTGRLRNPVGLPCSLPPVKRGGGGVKGSLMEEDMPPLVLCARNNTEQLMVNFCGQEYRIKPVLPRDGRGGKNRFLKVIMCMGVVPSDKMYEDDCLPPPILKAGNNHHGQV